MVLKIESLDSKKHDLLNFYCGKDSLDSYIRRQASQDLKKKVAKTFVLVDAPATKVLAYYTLSFYVVDTSVLEDALAKSLPRYPRLPATLLGRLAVDQQQKGKGLGELMLFDALKKSLIASEYIASLSVISEALDEEAANFYLKYGFQRFKNQPQKLYLSMKSIV